MRKPSSPKLDDGTFSYDYSTKALEAGGFATFGALKDFLKVDSAVLSQHMKALGIFLEPFVRRESYMTKVYKKRRRPFTEEEAKRIIERHRALQGRDE